jgi:8-oxo-dGTP pyrophosphatase MutT (NUDIX family)
MKTLEEIIPELIGHTDNGREIRIPGGKSKEGNHACFGIASRIREDDIEEILVIPYNPKVKKPLGMSENEYPEDKEGTLQREYLEETGVITNTYSLLGQLNVRDNRPGMEDEIHVRYAWAITSYDDSNIRTKPPRSKRIYPPIWVPIPLLETFLWPNHKWMLSLYKEYQQNPGLYRSRTIRNPKLLKSAA